MVSVKKYRTTIRNLIKKLKAEQFKICNNIKKCYNKTEENYPLVNILLESGKIYSKFVLDNPPLLGNKPHIDFIKSLKKQRKYYLVIYLDKTHHTDQLTNNIIFAYIVILIF